MSTLSLLAALLTLAGSARAPSVEEQRLFDEGMRAFQGGDARGAEKSWRAGYAVAHDPAFLVRIGEAEERAGAPAEAAESYRRYLREAPDASDRADIEARVARLAPPSTPAAPGPASPVPADTPGEFGGSPPAVASPPAAASPRAPAAGAPLPPPGVPGARPGVDAERPETPQTAPDSGWNRYSVTAFIAAGAAVLLLGTAGFFAAEAGSDADDVNRLVLYRDQQTGAPDSYASIAQQYERAMANGRAHDRDAKLALVGAAGAAAVSVVFFVLDAKLAPEPAVSVSPTALGLGAVGGWTWRF